MGSGVQPARLPGRDGVVFVCSECGRGKALRRTLKGALKDRGWKKRLRVVAVSCLDLCPKRGVGVAVGATMGPLRGLVVRDEASVDETLVAIEGAVAQMCNTSSLTMRPDDVSGA
jgi:hypothetical protein